MKKKIFILGAVISVATISLTACGKSKEEQFIDRLQKEAQEYQKKYEEEQKKIKEEEEKKNNNIEVSDLTIKPTNVYKIESTGFMKYSAIDYDTYVIETKIKNKNNFSCDVYLQCELNVEDKEEREKKKKEDFILSNSSIYTPYTYKESSYNGYQEERYYLPGVALAPNEEKTIQYYIEDKSVYVKDANTGSDTHFVLEKSKINSIKLLAKKAKESKIIKYLQTKDLEDKIKVRIDEERELGETYYYCDFDGSITNNTDTRWNRGVLDFAVYLNDKIILKDTPIYNFGIVSVGETIKTDKTEKNVRIVDVMHQKSNITLKNTVFSYVE